MKYDAMIKERAGKGIKVANAFAVRWMMQEYSSSAIYLLLHQQCRYVGTRIHCWRLWHNLCKRSSLNSFISLFLLRNSRWDFKIQWSWFHKFQDNFISNCFASLLMCSANGCQNVNQFFFQKPSQKFATSVILK